MRLRVLALSLVVLLFAGFADAAGSVVVTTTSISLRFTKHTLVWTSDASGNVSGNTLGLVRGQIVQMTITPGAGGVQPSDLYDMRLNTPTSALNVLGTGGDNLSNATGKIVQFVPPWVHDALGEMDLVISNAGNAKQGTLVIWIER